MDEEDGHFDFHHRRFVFLVGFFGVVLLVVVEHAFEVGVVEGFDVLLPGFGVFHPEGECLGGEEFVGAFHLEVAGVLAVLLLLGVVGEFAGDATEVGQVEDDQLLDELRSVLSERPGDGTAPVVADDDGLLAAQVLDDGDDVADEELHLIVFAAFGFVAEVVATLIDGDAVEVAGEGGHLAAPGVPEVREAVDEEDEGFGFVAEGGVVDFDAIGIGVVVLDLGVEVLGVKKHEEGEEHGELVLSAES